MSEPLPIRVVGMGSPLGDDRVGWEVVQQLQRARHWRQGIEFHTVEGGQRLLDLLDGYGTLVLIDAMLSALSPGTVQRLEWPDPRLETCHPGTTHQCRPAEALQLAATLGFLPPRVTLWAVVAAHFQPCTGLSPAVVDVIPALVQRIANDLTASI